ncbi:hypothetical protein EYC55_12205 [Xanthomonas oryzae]|nr:hypothetical protein EYC55_12205 [Xanthomonas oryzae]QBH00008.1 hypothetical protein EYC56_12645 [Xanthomonas oryzae]
MICSSEKRFFTSNLLGIGNWTPNRCATQTRGDVAVEDADDLRQVDHRETQHQTPELILRPNARR